MQNKNTFSSFSSETASQNSQNLSFSDSHSSATNEHSIQDDNDYVMVVAPRRKTKKQVSINNDLRIVEYNLVLSTGLMKELNRVDILSRNCYFARYGQIAQIVISSKHQSFSAMNQDIQAFVTYKNQLDAAWTIAALKDLKHHYKHSIRIHYGTSRYCHRFVLGLPCANNGCFFNHKLRKDHQHKDVLKETLESQFQKVYILINDNLNYFVNKQYQEFKNKNSFDQEVTCSCYRKQQKVKFPTYKEVLTRLISEGIINKKRYEEVKNKIKFDNGALKQKNITSSTQGKQNKSKQTIQIRTVKKQQQRRPQKQIQIIHINDEKPYSTTTNQSQFPIINLRQQDQENHSQTLQEYLQNNSIYDASDLDSPYYSSSILQQKINKIRPFRGQKVGDLINIFSCKQIGVSPQMQISKYLIKKIMNKTFKYNFPLHSRFSFTQQIDYKTQINQSKKIAHIISKKIVNQ